MRTPRAMNLTQSEPETLVERQGSRSVDHDGQAARKHWKREQKRRRDAERQPDAWERFRILTESLEEARQVVEIADHKARYALVIMSVLNAAVLVFIARWDLFGDTPPTVKPWLIGLVVIYAILTFAFVLHAIDSLRPRRLDRVTVPAGAAHSVSPDRLSRGLLHWEVVLNHDLPELREAWDRVRMDEINAEAVTLSYAVSRVLQAKYRALAHLYRGLAILVMLAALILSLGAYFTLAI